MFDRLEIVLYSVVLLALIILKLLRKPSEHTSKPSREEIQNALRIVGVRPSRTQRQRLVPQSQIKQRNLNLRDASSDLSWRRTEKNCTEIVTRKNVPHDNNPCLFPREKPGISSEAPRRLSCVSQSEKDYQLESYNLTTSDIVVECSSDYFDGCVSQWYSSQGCQYDTHLQEEVIDYSLESVNNNDEGTIGHTSFSVDKDDERRRGYEKWSVTDGEVFLKLEEGVQICQIFVFGIEYHYCHIVKEDVLSWDLPDNIKEKHARWFLLLPKSKRKRFRILTPPPPVERTVESKVHFSPWDFRSYEVY